VNSCSPSTEYDATAKSDALLAIPALWSWILPAGIFLSRDAVALYGRIDNNVMPVCQHLIGHPFQVVMPVRTSNNANNMLSSNTILLLQGLDQSFDASDTSVKMTMAIVANLVPTRMDLPSSGSRAMSFPTC
jgi:hypothetical protein